MTQPATPRPQQTALEMPADLQPVYANLVRIAHSPADFVLDFAHLLPGESLAHVTARILMSPISAKLLYKALAENIARYETGFGEIRTPTATLADQLFKPPHSPETRPDEGNA